MKVIESYPDYAVTENGEVIRLKTMKRLKPIDCRGYQEVGLYRDGIMRREKVHRLVAEAFIPNPDNLPCINHKDENKANNSVDNLEWCSYSYNNNYGKNRPNNNLKQGAIKNSKRVVQISQSGEVVATYSSVREAARKTEINQSNITKCCLGKEHYKSAGGFCWRYE